jgi:hypothetical protein
MATGFLEPVCLVKKLVLKKNATKLKSKPKCEEFFFRFFSQELKFFSKNWEYFDRIFPFYFIFRIVTKFHIKKNLWYPLLIHITSDIRKTKSGTNMTTSPTQEKI